MEFRWCAQRIPGTRHRADIRTWRFPCRTSPASGGRQSIAMGRMRITAKLRAPQRRRRRAGWAHGGSLRLDTSPGPLNSTFSRRPGTGSRPRRQEQLRKGRSGSSEFPCAGKIDASNLGGRVQHPYETLHDQLGGPTTYKGSPHDLYKNRTLRPPSRRSHAYQEGRFVRNYGAIGEERAPSHRDERQRSIRCPSRTI